MTRLSVHLVRLLTPVPDFEDENVSSTSLLFPKVLFPCELGVVTFFLPPLRAFPMRHPALFYGWSSRSRPASALNLLNPGA